LQSQEYSKSLFNWLYVKPTVYGFNRNEYVGGVDGSMYLKKNTDI